MEHTTRPDRNSGAYVAAVLLIVIGVAAMLSNLGWSSSMDRAIPLVIGVAFLFVYALTRQYGFLVPGGILTGVGAGILTASLVGTADDGPYALLGGGAGFLLIFAIDVLVTRTANRWWPVIPGSLMLVAWGGSATPTEGLLHTAQIWSPILLVALGLLILVTRTRRPSP